ncbi:hypothetical protein CTI12_AA113740 [Artemisia annua]|uniref:Beta-carotene isomerase D27-like C-terminal domain-containing protein n=1 Tax=Artemisia annua TaxID=35608 RepID=A0A2U1P0X2_ARTAN|nr:hypothetical protein CTI12_AA113740 [Artemisia annua]
METTIFLTPARIGIPYSTRLNNSWPKRSRLTVVSALTPPTSTNNLKTESASSHSITTSTGTTKTVYKDNWFNHAAINYLSKAVQDTVGMRFEESGYARAWWLQLELFFLALTRSNNIKTVMRPSKVTREYFAGFTALFFPWLIGPCEVRESEFEGNKERNVVHVKKGRFLESTNCAGMCTNLCKIPSQEFIKDSFGVPCTMVPNFDDMSCEMIFGQEPPALKDDPVFKQPWKEDKHLACFLKDTEGVLGLKNLIDLETKQQGHQLVVYKGKSEDYFVLE